MVPIENNKNDTLADMSLEQMAEMIFQTEKGLVILEAAFKDRVIKKLNTPTPKSSIIKV